MALRINRLPPLSLHPGYCAYFSASVGKQVAYPLAYLYATRTHTTLSSLQRSIGHVRVCVCVCVCVSTSQLNLLHQDRRVNAWTQWGKLKEICVGNADFSCFPPVQVGYKFV